MIRFEHVTKRYEDKDALSDLNLEIRDGEIFGLIGHNGAGKTTTISILTSIIEASYGEVYVDDMALSQHRDAIKKKIAYVPDSPDSSFSHGMRQKVVVIGALLVNPQIWVLDEPLTGLDPQASYDLKEAMRHHAKEGNSVLFSTHVLSVAEQLCDRIGILKKGKLIFQGSLAELKAQYPDKDLESIYLEMVGRKVEEV